MKLYIDVRGQDLTGLYEDWGWLIKPTEIKKSVLMNQFGDLFFQSMRKGICFLDLHTGSVGDVAKDLSELQSILNDPGVQDRLLFSPLVDQLAIQDMITEDGQLYSFKIPLHLGGTATVDNIELSDKEVAISILGQIQAQTRGLPTGTKVEGMGLKQDLPSRI